MFIYNKVGEAGYGCEVLVLSGVLVEWSSFAQAVNVGCDQAGL